MDFLDALFDKHAHGHISDQQLREQLSSILRQLNTVGRAYEASAIRDLEPLLHGVADDTKRPKIIGTVRLHLEAVGNRTYRPSTR